MQCQVRILEDPGSAGEVFQIGKARTQGYFDLDGGKGDGGMVYCFDDPFVLFKSGNE